MKCDICKKNDAVIHIKQTRGNQITDLNLCSECAAERGIDQANPQLEKVLETIFRSVREGKEKVSLPSERVVYCVHCGTSLSQIHKKNTVGCPFCYEIFEKELNEKHFHDKIYKGRIPSSMEPYRVLLQEVPRLEQQLKEALEVEDYQEARRIQSQIDSKKRGVF